MLKKFINKSSEFLAGFGMAVLVLGFAGVVTASTFSGPSNQPPNGFISPTFDGLTINGNLSVNPGPGERVNLADTFIDGLRTNTIFGCIGCPEFFGEQKLRLVSPVMDISSQDLEIGSLVTGSDVRVWSHMKARSIGYMYEVNSSRTMTDSTLGRLHIGSASCPSTTYLVSCNAYIMDFGRDFKFEGTATTSGRNCYGYARQFEDPASTATMYIEATCWNPDDLYNKNF